MRSSLWELRTGGQPCSIQSSADPLEGGKTECPQEPAGPGPLRRPLPGGGGRTLRSSPLAAQKPPGAHLGSTPHTGFAGYYFTEAGGDWGRGRGEKTQGRLARNGEDHFHPTRRRRSRTPSPQREGRRASPWFPPRVTRWQGQQAAPTGPKPAAGMGEASRRGRAAGDNRVAVPGPGSPPPRPLRASSLLQPGLHNGLEPGRNYHGAEPLRGPTPRGNEPERRPEARAVSALSFPVAPARRLLPFGVLSLFLIVPVYPARVLVVQLQALLAGRRLAVLRHRGGAD